MKLNRVCSLCKQELSLDKFSYSKKSGYYHSYCKECDNQRSKQERQLHPEKEMLRRTKQRAQLKNIPFLLTEKDIHIPSHCPVLNIPLQIQDNRLNDHSPSLDRILPELGYVVGNVHVISQKANQIKTNATVQELELVAKYFKELHEVK